MTARGVTTVLVAGVLLLPAFASAQDTKARIAAATAFVGNRPEVRLRVQLESGWLPASGVRIYREVNGRRELIHQRAVSDAEADRALDAGLRGKGLWSRAATRTVTPRALDFRAVRPPSAATRFRQLKSASDALLQLRQQPDPDPVRRASIQQQLGQLATLRAQAPARLAPSAALRPGLGAASPGDADVMTARGRFMLLALVRSAAAESLGLGTRDRAVKAGDRVRYTVALAPARGAAELVLDSVTVVVGTDPQPPAPAGVESQQMVDDDGEPSGTVAIRWERLDAALEVALLNASYVIERRHAPPVRAGLGSRIGSLPQLAKGAAPPDTVWRRAHEKPVMIAAINGDEEPLAFFEDELERPGTYEYRIALVDGFGRQSAWSEHTVGVVDWRRPAAPGTPLAELDEEPRDAEAGRIAKGAGRAALGLGRLQTPPRDLGAWAASPYTLGGKAAVRVSWSAVDAPADLVTRYRVFRIDTEAPNARPVLVTPQPIEGTALPATPEQDSAQARIRTLSKSAASASALRAATLATRGGMLATRAELSRLRDIARPRLSFTDVGVGTDRYYAYVVRAVYVPSGLESEDAPASAVAVPSPARPPVVTGATYDGFTASEKLTPGQQLADTTAQSRAPAFTSLRQGKPRLAPAAKRFRAAAATERSFAGSKSIALGARKSTTGPAGAAGALAKPASGASATGGLAGVSRAAPTADLPRTALVPRLPVFAKTDLSRLRLNLARARDDGGVVTLRWTATPGLKGVTYRIQRKYGDLDWVEVGVTRANQTTHRDVLPRSMARTYSYRVLAVTRWGVEGAPSAVVSAAVPSTVRPGVPNVLAAAPDRATDRAIRVRIDPNPADESVTAYRVLRDGAPVGVVAAAAGAELVYLDSGLVPDRSYRYEVVAETAAGLKSDPSRRLSAVALKLATAAPTELRATAEAGGVRLAWKAAADAASYTVQRRTAPGAPPQILAGGLRGTVAYLDVTAMPTKSYVYEVLAADAFGNISPAAAASVTVP